MHRTKLMAVSEVLFSDHIAHPNAAEAGADPDIQSLLLLVGESRTTTTPIDTYIHLISHHHSMAEGGMQDMDTGRSK